MEAVLFGCSYAFVITMFFWLRMEYRRDITALEYKLESLRNDVFGKKK